MNEEIIDNSETLYHRTIERRRKIVNLYNQQIHDKIE